MTNDEAATFAEAYADELANGYWFEDAAWWHRKARALRNRSKETPDDH